MLIEEEGTTKEKKDNNNPSYQRVSSGTAVISEDIATPNYPIKTEHYDSEGNRLLGPYDTDPVSSALLEQRRKMQESKPIADYLSKIDGVDIQIDNLVAAARNIENQFAALIHQARRDPALAEAWESKVKEIQDKHRKRGRNWQIEKQLLSNVLDYFK